jgi:hypothetical protein
MTPTPPHPGPSLWMAFAQISTAPTCCCRLSIGSRSCCRTVDTRENNERKNPNFPPNHKPELRLPVGRPRSTMSALGRGGCGWGRLSRRRPCRFPAGTLGRDQQDDQEDRKGNLLVTNHTQADPDLCWQLLLWLTRRAADLALSPAAHAAWPVPMRRAASVPWRKEEKRE